MPRPALSASRSIDIITFLASFPDRGFTFSEIVRATGINVASCHAILAALADRGYLVRQAEQKSYTLGSALIAAGQAALKSQPIVERARLAAELRQELGLAVMLSTIAGEEILAVLSLEDAQGRFAGLRAGERVPLVAPVGTPFLSWASEEAVAAWIARRAAPSARDLVDEWRRDLELTRQRGFQVTLRSPAGPTIASLMNDMASARGLADFKGKMAQVLNSFDRQAAQPETIEDDHLYDVILIASPLLDRNGNAAFNLCIGGFPQMLTGEMLTQYANRLMRACLEIMRATRPPLLAR